MKITRPTKLPKTAMIPLVFVLTGLLCFLLSIWTVSAIERFSKLGVRRVLTEAGHAWVEVGSDGLQVTLSGTAPTEAMRFRALAIAGQVVDAARLRDAMDVADRAVIAAPTFSIEILRNDDGISLIGLAPAEMDRAPILADLERMAAGAPVTDMLESAEYKAPENWDSSVKFAVTALRTLPRSKISVEAGQVSITAISDSAAQKINFETDLRRKAPEGVKVTLDISAPRPVIAPFTLRFLIDDSGARFDACSAASDQAAMRIMAAAIDAGASPNSVCTIGLGVPSPEWADAVVLGLKAMKDIGHGSITFSDADVALLAEADVPQDVFDAAVGALESNLPDVFSLHATLAEPATGAKTSGPIEFSATLSAEGRVDLRGRVSDAMSRDAVESFAKARFGVDAVRPATRLDENLPEGWPARVLVALEALGELRSGKVVVTPEQISIQGITGSQESSGNVARILSSRLGEGGNYAINVEYEAALDPLLGLPTDEECIDQINQALAAKKINFEPGSAVIEPDSMQTIDKIAELMKDCSDFPMEIGGHTDAQGREEMNLALSDQRARAIIVALQSRRVLTGHLEAVGYGETTPIEANNTEAGREANRRIEFRLLKPSSGEAAPDAGEDTGQDATTSVSVQTPDATTPRPKPRPPTLDQAE
ncbi:MAG: OmpA family protein [Albidovulum sp.]